MKVNGIDARKYNAKQLTAEVLPPSLAVDYEIVTGAILPTEFNTDTELGKLKLCMYFRGKDRNSLIRKMSAFLEKLHKVKCAGSGRLQRKVQSLHSKQRLFKDESEDQIQAEHRS